MTGRKKMLCYSCRSDIPSQWTSCIALNRCPACDGPICSKESQELMEELKTAMEQMQTADAQAVAGWLLSNYDIRKKNSELEPTEFFGQTKTQPGEELKVANSFFQRAGVAPAKNPVPGSKDWAKMVASIQEEGAREPDLEEMPQLDYDDDEPPIPLVAHPMAQSAFQNNTMTMPPPPGGAVPIDMASIMNAIEEPPPQTEGERILQQERMARLRKAQGFDRSIKSR